MSSPIKEVFPKHLYTPVAPSLLHERQFNLLLIQSEQQQKLKKERKRSFSERNTTNNKTVLTRS